MPRSNHLSYRDAISDYVVNGDFVSTFCRKVYIVVILGGGLGLIAFEVAFLMFLGVVSVVTIAAIGRPLAEAYSEKMKQRYRLMLPAAEEHLRERMETQEMQLLELKDEIADLRFTNEFLLNHLKMNGLDTETLKVEREKRATAEPKLLKIPKKQDQP